MQNRWPIVLLVVGAIAGYAAGGTSVRAQGDALPFSIGDTITIHYERLVPDRVGETVQCTVKDIRGIYVKCGSRSDVATFQESENWRSLRKATQITKHPR